MMLQAADNVSGSARHLMMKSMHVSRSIRAELHWSDTGATIIDIQRLVENEVVLLAAVVVSINRKFRCRRETARRSASFKIQQLYFIKKLVAIMKQQNKN